MSMSDFYVRDAQNEGNKIPLNTPDGKTTDHYLVIKGHHSDGFKSANLRAMRKAMREEQTPEETERARIEVLATLIKDWSFEEDLTNENIIKFLINAPQIAEVIDVYAANNKNFLEKK